MSKYITSVGKGAAVDATEDEANISTSAGINQAIAGATHTVDITDQSDTLEFTNGGAVAVTLDDITTILTASHTSDFKVTLISIGAGTIVTITPNATDSFNTGDSTIVLKENEYITLQTDSTNAIWNVIGVKPKGWRLLTVKNASASANIDFTSSDGIGALYDYYKIEFYNAICDTSGLMRARVSIATVFQTSSNYETISTNAANTFGSYWRINKESSDSAATGSGTTHGTLQFTLGDEANDHPPLAMGQIATASALSITGSSKELAESLSLTYEVTGAVTAIDGIRFYASSGNIARGTFMLYGMRN